jgi:membrane-associated phospholipid phosphatase
MIRYRILAVLMLTLAVTPTLPRPLAGQDRQVAPIQWWQGAIVVGGLSALALLDNPLRSFVQDRRSPGNDRVAATIRPMGEVKLYLGLTGGLVATGLLSGQSKLTNAGTRLAATLAMTGLGVQVGKMAAGRARPGRLFDADDFSPFSGRHSMPSGHTTTAFALATELADDIHRPWATAGLYTLATAVGWSRINDDKHWLTDVCAGAIFGIAAAKVIDGRWRLFNLRPPSLAITPQRLGLAWQASF